MNWTGNTDWLRWSRALAIGLLLWRSAPVAAADFDAAVQESLDSHLRENRIAGGAVGVLYHGTFHPFVAGVRDRETGAPVTEETLFPLGSITKVFTAMMLAHLANEGSVRLNDGVVAYLPGDVRQKAGDLKTVTLLDLATHTSGMTDASPNDPAEDLYFDLPPDAALISDWIAWTPTPPEPRDPYLYYYSNKGFLTLGFAVATAGKRGGYNPLFQELFRTPLGLRYLQTRGTMGPEMLALVTRGYGDSVRPNPNVGNGVNANLIDLEPLLRALLLAPETPRALRDAIALSQRPARSKLLEDPDRWMGLGWDLDLGTPYQISKNGATAGVFAVIRLYPQEHLAVAIMLNGKSPNDDSGSGMGALAREVREIVQARGARNLALDRPTRQSDGRTPTGANDGSKRPNSSWSGDGLESWWQVDLEAIAPVSELLVLPAWTPATAQPYTVWTSLDEKAWDLLVDQSRASEPAGLAGDYRRIRPVLARYVRVQSAGVPLKLVEVEIFEHPDLTAAVLHHARPNIQLPASEPRAATYSFSRLTADPRVHYQATVSRDLKTWAPIESSFGAPTVIEESPGISERVSWELEGAAVSEAAPTFIRLEIRP